MERLFILMLLLASCSISQPEQNSDFNHSQIPAEDWIIASNTEYGRYARVSAIGQTPDGEGYTILKLECPTKKNKEDITSFVFSVNNPDKIPNFDFGYFEGPNAPALNEKLVEIQASSPQSDLSWHFMATGSLGGYAEVISFDFSPSRNNNPDKAAEFARMIAAGSTAVTITVLDGRDNQKVIKASFPAIDPTSKTAQILNGCRE